MASVIDTLGKAARHGMAVRVTCRTCANETTFMASDLASLYGFNLEPRALRFRCRKCGHASYRTSVLELDPDQRKGQIVWVPKRLA